MTWKDWLLILSFSGLIALLMFLLYLWWDKKRTIRSYEESAQEQVKNWTQDNLLKEQRLNAEEAQEKLLKRYGQKKEDK